MHQPNRIGSYSLECFHVGFSGRGGLAPPQLIDVLGGFPQEFLDPLVLGCLRRLAWAGSLQLRGQRSNSVKSRQVTGGPHEFNDRSGE